MNQVLVDRGVLKRMPDGRLCLTRTAWKSVTDGTPYSEPPAFHFVGFKDDRWWNARKTFGAPDFVHRFWDRRAVGDVLDGDVVIFADGDEAQPVREYAYDDSANF